MSSTIVTIAALAKVLGLRAPFEIASSTCMRSASAPAQTASRSLPSRARTQSLIAPPLDIARFGHFTNPSVQAQQFEWRFSHSQALAGAVFTRLMRAGRPIHRQRLTMTASAEVP